MKIPVACICEIFIQYPVPLFLMLLLLLSSLYKSKGKVVPVLN